MSLFPGYNPEGAGLELARALLEQERADRDAPPEPEEVVLTRRLCRALDCGTIQAKLVALRVLTLCIRNGEVRRSDLAVLRDNPLSDPGVPPGSTKLFRWTPPTGEGDSPPSSPSPAPPPAMGRDGAWAKEQRRIGRLQRAALHRMYGRIARFPWLARLLKGS